MRHRQLVDRDEGRNPFLPFNHVRIGPEVPYSFLPVVCTEFIVIVRREECIRAVCQKEEAVQHEIQSEWLDRDIQLSLLTEGYSQYPSRRYLKCTESVVLCAECSVQCQEVTATLPVNACLEKQFPSGQFPEGEQCIVPFLIDAHCILAYKEHGGDGQQFGRSYPYAVGCQCLCSRQFAFLSSRSTAAG